MLVGLFKDFKSLVVYKGELFKAGSMFKISSASLDSEFIVLYCLDV